MKTPVVDLIIGIHFLYLTLRGLLLALGPWAGKPNVGLVLLLPLGGPLQPRYLSWFLTTISRCGTDLFHTSNPPTSLEVASSVCCRTFIQLPQAVPKGGRSAVELILTWFWEEASTASTFSTTLTPPCPLSFIFSLFLKVKLPCSIMYLLPEEQPLC